MRTSYSIGYVVVLILFLAACSSSMPSSPFESSRTQPAIMAGGQTSLPAEDNLIKIDAANLFAEYDANEVAADLKYKGKTLEVSGVITNFRNDLYGNPVVFFGISTGGYSGVEVTFGKGMAITIATLSKGQRVIIRGMCNGKSVGDVQLQADSIVSSLTSNITGAREVPSVVTFEWQNEWNGVLAEAKKEGRVIIYISGGTEAQTALIPTFQEKYGIQAEFVIVKSSEIGQKLLGERNTNPADVYMGDAMTQITRLQPAGVLANLEKTLILPEVKDSRAWWGDSLLWVDSRHRSLAFSTSIIPAYAINRTLVIPEEVKSYRDLLNPKWKGKIILNDPTRDGIGQQGMSFILDTFGLEFLKNLAKQEPVIVRDQRLQVEWLAARKYPIALFCRADDIALFMKAGNPIKEVLPLEGQALTGGTGNLSFIEQAPHPNAAKVFINWLLGREGQTLYSKAVSVQSAREDILIDFLDPVKRRVPGMKYVWIQTEEKLLKIENEESSLFKITFSPLIK